MFQNFDNDDCADKRWQYVGHLNANDLIQNQKPVSPSRAQDESPWALRQSGVLLYCKNAKTEWGAM